MRAFVFTNAGLGKRADEFVWLAIDTENPKNAEAVKKLKPVALPTYYVLDPKDGTVAKRWVGGMTLKQLDNFLSEGSSTIAMKHSGVAAMIAGDTEKPIAKGDRLYGEGDYAQHWLNVIGKVTDKPIFAHVNWFQRDPEDGHFLWPGYRENVRALVWLIQAKLGEVKGNATAVGIIPTRDELLLDGLETEPGDLDKLLTIDVARWKQEMGYREEHLNGFTNVPEAIWEAHRRVAAALACERRSRNA